MQWRRAHEISKVSGKKDTGIVGSETDLFARRRLLVSLDTSHELDFARRSLGQRKLANFLATLDSSRNVVGDRGRAKVRAR
jgi:hypothetical protein